jgi:pimeloyl-ACP methyl ester carboxylesterase
VAEQSGSIERPDGVALAYRRHAGRGPGVVFLGGFNSDLTGTKAAHLAACCAAEGRAFLRFDYSGHGASGGRFVDGTIGQWLDDALRCFDALTEGPQVLVGSSMGGWLALLLALRRERVRGLVGVAAAPDFTQRIQQHLTPEAKAALTRDGVWHRPSQYGAPYPITRRLLEEGASHLLLPAPIPLRIPVRLLHGQRDPDVPWQQSLAIAERLSGDDVQVLLMKDGDHRLSTPRDLALLSAAVAGLVDGA